MGARSKVVGGQRKGDRSAAQVCGRRGLPLKEGFRRSVVRRKGVVVTATMAPMKVTTTFLSKETAEEIATKFGSPTYVYDLKLLRQQARKALSYPNDFGLTVRYAMKASPNAAILRTFYDMGLSFDASSVYEAQRAINAGIPADRICLSSQQLDDDFVRLVNLGVQVNACSLNQLERYGQAFPNSQVGVRFNPGLGSGGTGKTNVGGPSSSFGIWHELKDEVKAVAAKHGVSVIRIHSHIGSGSDPSVWQRVAGLTLNLVREFPDVTTMNLGGGYKVGRMPGEPSTILDVVSKPVQEAIFRFAEETGRKLKLEIEPGTYLVANAGALLCKVQDIVSTGESGHKFIKLDTGMTELLRPSLYGALHPITIFPRDDSRLSSEDNYVVVGHCCESGDLFTPAPGEPETIAERLLTSAEIGDLCVVDGAGAYCSGMSSKNYNSFPEASEVLVDESGGVHLIRERQLLEAITVNEVALPSGL